MDQHLPRTFKPTRRNGNVVQMGASIWAGVCGATLSAELCAPLLLLCWLCCWPDHSSDTSSDNGKHPGKPVVQNESSSRRRSGESLCRRIGSSAASLHLPSTSGHKQPLSAYRSHEDIPQRSVTLAPPDERYHSAPSVIDEILHRRDWERSSKDLYIPLKLPEELRVIDQIDSDDSPEAPFAEAESSSIEILRSEERLSNIPCKKHYTNIKRSRNKVNKESTDDLDKDTDATENDSNVTSNYYTNDKTKPDIRVTSHQDCTSAKDFDGDNGKVKAMYKAKEAKQSLNETIKSMDRPVEKMGLKKLCGSERYQAYTFDIDLDSPIDRSGAEPASPDSRASLLTCTSRMELHPNIEASVPAWGTRPRTQSDGDVLSRARRPTSGAFSESDLELDLEGNSGDERPPSYEELTSEHIGYAKETAI